MQPLPAREGEFSFSFMGEAPPCLYYASERMTMMKQQQARESFYGMGLALRCLAGLASRVGLAASRVTAFRHHKAHIQTYTDANVQTKTQMSKVHSVY